ncbi:MAG TPA: hypothetical protein VMV27_08970 [Candidatus Binataceae bacterium]|nr:hypothetical protein [Candidatus Binataceae bacterium]
MKLPNGEDAVVDIVKLRDYCLNLGHPEGRHKARVFQSALAMGREDAARLRTRLLAAARIEDSHFTGADEYGRLYTLDFTMRHREREATVRAAWIVRRGENFLRLTTCFVLGGH